MNTEKILAMETKINKSAKNIVGMVVLKEGQKVYEHYAPDCCPSSQIHVYSVTKSIVSLLIGIAIEQGYIQSVNQKVVDFFPEHVICAKEKTFQEITLKHILTMTAPYRFHFAPYIKYFTSEDWVEFTLTQLGGKGKIGKFNYTPLIGPDILTGILTKTTGLSVLEFAQANLFNPLDIHIDKKITFQSKEEQLAFNQSTTMSGWVSDPQGTQSAGWGLTLSAIDMAKIGQCCLDGGKWHNTQIIPTSWIQQSTQEQSRWHKEDLPFGYCWWLDKNQEGFAAMGDGGNVIYVNTKKKLVVAIASLFMPRITDRLDLINQYIEPAFDE